MKNPVIFLVVLFFCLTGFSQTDYLLVNKLNCDLVYNLRVVPSNNCSNVISAPSVTVPAHTSSLFTAPVGTEIENISVGFVVNNCVGMSLSSPANANCPNCPNWFMTQGSWTSTCNNACQGMTINSKWFQSCNNVDQIVYYH